MTFLIFFDKLVLLSEQKVGWKRMSTVRVGENESLDSALKRFKRKCQKDGIIGDIRKKEAYLKPGIKKKLKSEAAQKRNRKGN